MVTTAKITAHFFSLFTMFSMMPPIEILKRKNQKFKLTRLADDILAGLAKNCSCEIYEALL